VSTPDVLAILQSLRSTGFRDLSDARLSATVPVSERLINQVVAASLPPSVPVREVHVHPEAGDRFSVRLTARSGFLPSLTLKLAIERQPELPGSPELVLRMATMGGLFGLATAAFPIARMLPPGVSLDGELIRVDVRALAAQSGAADLLHLAKRLVVRTEEGRMVIDVEAAV
jgi:hypothetical protein